VEQPFADAAGWHPGPIALRSSWQRVVMPAVVSGLMPAIVPVMLLLGNHPHAPAYHPFDLLPIAFSLAVCALSLWGERRKQLVLRAGSLTLRAGWRKREIAAADIAAVTLDRVAASRMVTIWTRDGKAHRASVAGRGRGLFRQSFDRDWHLVGQWWLANRGDTWQPVLPTVPTFATSWMVPIGFDWRPQT